jgi:hypothetical protein
MQGTGEQKLLESTPLSVSFVSSVAGAVDIFGC